MTNTKSGVYGYVYLLISHTNILQYIDNKLQYIVIVLLGLFKISINSIDGALSNNSIAIYCFLALVYGVMHSFNNN